ncbi:ABC transporter permease [Chryseolinea lacunae]|uniref:ABC transporter permease n=1 Tax=Chryseolinea lacunae TaxID=2801331 RepID=UPI001F33FABC|nr:ABC transporter permease [Chryseolinea lacunae]
MQAQQKENIISSDRSVILNLSELWSYRELFYFFTWRDVKVKYKQTTLGVIWVVLQPILTVIIFSFFFGRALNVEKTSPGLPYPVFVFSGLLLWNFFSSSVNSAGNSMLTNAPIIKKIYFPRIIIPVTALLVSGVDFIVAFVAYVGVLIYYNVHIDFMALLIFWPISIMFLLLGTLGISCWLAALNVKYRDFRYVIPFGLQIALFVSPVIYPASIISERWVNYVLALNPMYAAINFFRVPLTGANSIDIVLMLISSVSSTLFVLLGIYYFKRTEAFFADIA